MVNYKIQLAKKTGSLGPKGNAFWPKINGTTGPLWSMEASPLIYNTTTGLYNTAYDANAANSSASFAKWRSYGKTRKRNSKRKVSKRKKSNRRKWKSPSRSSRKKIINKCGKQCFLGDNLKFPICNINCSVNSSGLEAAYKRARQYKYRSIAKKAKSMLKHNSTKSTGKKTRKRSHKKI